MELERVWRQVTCKNVKGDEFGASLLDFDWNVGGKNAMLMHKSYFRVGLGLRCRDTETSDWRQPVMEDGVALANNAAGNLMNNCHFYMGGANVSSCVTNLPQAHAIKNRITKSGAWLNSVGKMHGISPNFHARQREVCNILPADDPAFGFPITPALDESGTREIYQMYQPPIGIFNHSKPMGSGDYRIQFNPNPNWKTSCVESLSGSNPKLHDVYFVSIEFYLCTIKMDIGATGGESIELTEHQVYSKGISTGETNFDFTVPSSTKAISIFVQGAIAGTDTRIPLSNFTTLDYGERSLRSLQISYGSVTKPPTRWASKYDLMTGVNQLQQRYYDSLIESDQAFNDGGAEPFSHWLMSPMIHYSFERDSEDRASQVQLQIDYGTMETKSNLYIVAHYTRRIDWTITNGFVSSVNARSI